MSREAQFLVAAVRRFLSPPSETAASLDTTGLDWPELLELSDAHAVTTMLFAGLRDTPIPEKITDELRARVQTSVRYSLAQSRELAQLAGLFEEHRISFVALKGPMLSQYLYGALGGRTSGDIDVLAKPGDVPRIHRALVSCGYVLESTAHWLSGSAYLHCREPARKRSRLKPRPA